MGLYTTKGLYNHYDKKHKERDKTDYYATPTVEVKNILDTLHIDFSNQTILEPCAGGGHMVEGIYDYVLSNLQTDVKIIATDLHEHKRVNLYPILTGENYDFLSDDYQIPTDKVDWIIMNPPYATIEPFTIRALEIADRGVIMLARLQFLEGEKRYENILKDNPPTSVFVYVDRIQCWKDGVESKDSSAQAYAWFVWDKEDEKFDWEPGPFIWWLRRSDKV